MGPSYAIAYILHVTGVFMWVGGLFQLVTTLLHHSREYNNPNFPVLHESLSKFENRIVKLAIFPGLGLALIGGIWRLAMNLQMFRIGAFHGKLAISILFIGYTLFILKKMKAFQATVPTAREPLFGMLNGVLGILLLLIVFFLSRLP